MKILSVGEYIREERRKQGLKQVELCDGLCSQVTLSRIESGIQTPNIRTLNALLERLGLPGEKFYAILSEEEERIEDLKKEISRCCTEYGRQNKDESLKSGRKYLEELETLANQEDRMLRQFILHFRGVFGTIEGPYSFEKKMELLIEAIRTTVPDFSINTIPNHRYCLEEMKVIQSIAQTYSLRGDHLTALNIFHESYIYIEKYNKKIIKSAGLFPYVALWYAMELGICGFYRESVEYAECGRQSCIKYGHYQALPELIHTKAESYYHMGDVDNGRKQSVLAYSLYCALDDNINKDALIRDVKKYYDINLENMFI